MSNFSLFLCSKTASKNMRGYRFLVIFCVGVLLSCLSPATAKPVNGALGLTVDISVDGFFSPKVQIVKVLKVRPNFPAANAGINPGDEVLAVDGKKLRGATKEDLKPITHGIRIGEHVTAVLSRPDGSTFSVDLVAVADTTN
jgi:S1-C subfamily serine protease